jgi:preprotein translocase subunit SecG
MSILLNILLVVFVLVALLMILIILMQRPKSEGLGAAFGGGVTENIFGAQTTNVLTKITGWLAGIFFSLTFLLSILYAHQTNANSGLRIELMKSEPAAANVPTPAPGPSTAVGAPGTVTNPAPGPAEPGIAPGEPASPADQAVGLTAPTAPIEAPAATAAPAASAKPQP